MTNETSSAEAPPLGEIDPTNMQRGPEQRIQATVGQAFIVRLDNAPFEGSAEKNPGSSWFNGHDGEYLRNTRSGWSVDYLSKSFTWAEFVPQKVGTTVIQGIFQPSIINPLFIQHDWTVTINK